MIKFKSIFLLGAALTGMAVATSCDDDDYESREAISVTGATEFAVAKAGTTEPLTITVKATTRPTATTEADWIHFGPDGKDNDNTTSVTLVDAATGTYEVTFTVDPNDEGPARNSYIHLFSFSKTCSVFVGQEGNESTVVPSDQLNYGSLGMVSDAKTLAKAMTAGINIGNTLEATGGESSWGNPEVNKEYIAGLKALGFNAVRIPCSWDQYVIDAENNTIDPQWLSRVATVVNYCVENDMYAIVNTHWDGGWFEDHMSEGYKTSIDEKLAAFWQQIATALNPFDEHLLFAGMNEPGVNGGIEADGIDALQKYQQTFINTVRATGGNNATRTLVVQAPQTNIDRAVNEYKLPTDEVADRLMVEVHFYDPYQFVMMEEDANWGKVWYYWGAANHIEGSDRNADSNVEEAYVAAQFGKMKSKFVDAGIPCIAGEYSMCVTRTGDDVDVDAWTASAELWTETVTREAKTNGVVPFFWETGGVINRTSGAARQPNIVDAIMRGATATYPF